MPLEIQFIKSTMYNGPTPNPCTIFKHVMDGMAMQGDEYIFKEDPNNMVPTGIMTLEGTTMTVLHGQKQLPDGRTGKWPKHTCNGKTFDSFNKPTNEVVGTATFTYQASANEGVLTVIVTNEPEVVVKEEKEEKDEDAMSEQEDNKEKEEEAMSDEEDEKKDTEDPNRIKHPHVIIAERKALASQMAQEAANQAAEIKAAQEKADKLAFDEMSNEFKTGMAQIKEKKEDIKQTENDMFLSAFEQVDYVPLSMVAKPQNVTKPPACATVRMWHVYKAAEENAVMAAKIMRIAMWYAVMEGGDAKTINYEKFFNFFLHNNPTESAKAEEALRVYKEGGNKRRKTEAASAGSASGKKKDEAAGSGSRGSRTPRLSRKISAGLKGIVNAFEKEAAKSNKKD